MKIFDNISEIVRDDMVTTIAKGSRVSVAAACFSMYAYKELKKAGIKEIYYLSREELAYDPDAWVDYVHPSDVGMMRQAAAVEKKLRKMIK